MSIELRSDRSRSDPNSPAPRIGRARQGRREGERKDCRDGFPGAAHVSVVAFIQFRPGASACDERPYKAARTSSAILQSIGACSRMLGARMLVCVVASHEAAGGGPEDTVMAGIVTRHASHDGSLEATFGRCRGDHARHCQQQDRQNSRASHPVTFLCCHSEVPPNGFQKSTHPVVPCQQENSPREGLFRSRPLLIPPVAAVSTSPVRATAAL